MESSETNSTSLATIHGFRVQSYGKRLSSGFKRGLRRLAERGFDDPKCVVVKTSSGSRSGITHAGGRYVDPNNPYRIEVKHAMRELGMEPPSPPFILAPGEYTLYHEWGHYIDRCWSRDQEVTFSFRWLSRFYVLGTQPSRNSHSGQGFTFNFDDLRPIESSDVQTADAVVFWWRVSSELFADLFEDWMRAEKKISWDQCEPKSLNLSEALGHPRVGIALLPGVGPEDVRAETYALFKARTQSAADLPPVRSGMFGANTDEMVSYLRNVLGGMRTGQL